MKRLLVALAFMSLAALGQKVGLEPVAQNLDKPVFLTQEPGGPLLAVLQKGRIVALTSGGQSPWLDVSNKVSCCGQRGLLSIAFHPGYRKNRRFFLYYTDRRGYVVIEEYRRKKPFRNLLRIKEPSPNNNGGGLAFGPDGYLYVGTGDGGVTGDPQNNAQNPASLLGKVLRIDVDGGNPYAIPDDNPFAFNDSYRPEIWALGLRNPWRFSFDRESGDLYLGDQGQNNWEEIDYVPAPPGSGGGLNFGWNVLEGNHCFKANKECSRLRMEPPIIEYSHKVGCGVVGGYVYRGSKMPALQGSYLFGDYCKGLVWQAVWQGDAWKTKVLLRSDLKISSFGEDSTGELYLVDYGGAVYRLVPSR